MSHHSRMNQAAGSGHDAARVMSGVELDLFERSGASADGLEEFLETADATPASAPRLTLRHGDDLFDLDEEIEALEAVGRRDHVEDRPADDNDAAEAMELSRAAEASAAAEAEMPAGDVDDSHDSWPWDHDLKESGAASSAGADIVSDDGEEEALADELRRVRIGDAEENSVPAAREAVDEDDHSAIEDVVLSMPMMRTPIEETLSHFVSQMEHEDEVMGAAGRSTEAAGHLTDKTEAAEVHAETAEEAHASAESAETHGETRPAVGAPKKIGGGQLVPARLTWRPGDPFAERGASVYRFRWDVMLTSAGITAACGIFGVWLLRTLLA